MKFRGEFVINNVAGSNLVIPLDSDTVDFNKMITVNETGVFLWEGIESGKTEAELLESMLKEYDIDEETAKQDIKEFIDMLKENNILE